MEQNNFNEKEALVLIEEMIYKAKQNISSNGFYFLLWGWLVFIAAVSHLYLIWFTTIALAALPWIILMPLGGVLTMFFGMREKKNALHVKSYVDDLMQIMIRAFSISMFVVCFAMPAGNQWKAFYPTILVIYAIWLFVSGGMLKFKPLQWGGVLNWCLAIVGFVYADTTVHLILIATAVLGGYIVPGYLLNQRYKKENV